jgi:hypothetical protein
MLRENRFGERHGALRERREWFAGGVLQELVERDVQAKRLRGNGGEWHVLRYRAGCGHGACRRYKSPSGEIMAKADLWGVQMRA